MKTVEKLVEQVGIARRHYLDQIKDCAESRAQWKPATEVWNIVENTEHLFWAEQGAIVGMWKTINAIREGKMPHTYESIHRNMPVEEIIKLTWKEKEEVPAIAAPRFGGPLPFWHHSLSSLQEVLYAFGRNLKDDELRIQAHPHPISGAMDFQQRLEFLIFHINRHREQVARLIIEMK